ncbi:putative fasciclin-like arabinogalactan protein 20 [Senna tora]|uniref:Putative fasciclin-like arabinogalactan protein 20 n=1 Tax=Senna tora TaxID=362788 RepID=A0A834SSY6_9FABA|nr:putative fasciclin-like arabinogalactan protein 20 [Senna tora]
MASSLFFFFFFLSLILLSLSSSLPSSLILDAAEILSSSGYQTMALNLELASQTLHPLTPSLTIFAPSDLAFKKIDHLPLSLLQYHLLPHAFSLQSLSSLPFGAKIATLLPGQPLTVTKSHSDGSVSANNVTIEGPPVFDDGNLVIFGIEKLFDLYFQAPASRTLGGNSNPTRCISMTRSNDGVWFSGGSSFDEACETLRSKGCSVMASFLEMQFLGLRDRPQLTVFAPVDEAMAVNHTGRLRKYSSILRRHVVPCKILWSDLVGLDNGTVLRTYERGFGINVTKSGDDELQLNGVGVVFPELYFNDWLVVHGLQEVLVSVSKGREEEAKNSSSKVQEVIEPKQHVEEEEYPASHYHFSVFH